MATDLNILLAAARAAYPDAMAAEAAFMEEVKYRAGQGDLLSYIFYVHGPVHPDIRSFCFSPHSVVMAEHMGSSRRTMTVAHPEAGKTLLHRSELEMWIGMQTELSFRDPDVPPPSALLVMGTLDKQAKPQVHDIRNTIQFNPRYRKLFPHARPDIKEGWEKDVFFLKRPLEKHRPEATLLATGCEGDIQGGRYGFILTDDPISQKDAKSPTIVRDRVLWILATLERRVLEGGITRYVFTRWTERDAFDPLARITPTLVMPVYGFWEAHPEYGVTSETLWPAKWPKARVEIERNKLIDAGEAALWPLVWLCSPKQAEGAIIKRIWMHYAPNPLTQVVREAASVV